MTLAKSKSVPLAWRRGGGADLGLLGMKESEVPRSWAIWGVNDAWGPERLSTFLKNHHWDVANLSESCSRNGPCRTNAIQKESAPMEFELNDRYMTICNWKPKGKPPAEYETQKIAGRRWIPSGELSSISTF